MKATHQSQPCLRTTAKSFAWACEGTVSPRSSTPKASKIPSPTVSSNSIYSITRGWSYTDSRSDRSDATSATAEVGCTRPELHRGSTDEEKGKKEQERRCSRAWNGRDLIHRDACHSTSRMRFYGLRAFYFKYARRSSYLRVPLPRELLFLVRLTIRRRESRGILAKLEILLPRHWCFGSAKSVRLWGFKRWIGEKDEWILWVV